MAKSLQEQLMGAGLVDNKKAKAIKQETRKNKKQKGRAGLEKEEQAKRERLEQERQAKAEKDRALNDKRKEELREREIQSQIRQLVSTNKLAVDGDLGYQFADGSKIHKIYVDQTTQTALASGKLAIVRLDSNYCVVARPVAEKIAQRDEAYLVLLNDKSADAPDEDDPYKDYQIPDDLMW